MKDKRGDPPPNVVGLFKPAPPVPTSATILEGLELIRVFLTIRTAFDRKQVLQLAREMAANDSNAKT
jgi:hypothetical protein